MSDIHSRDEEYISGVDIEERGNSLRVASNTPHLVSLGCGRLSTAVTIHPLAQGGVVLGSDAACDIQLHGTGVHPKHCKVENSNDVVTLYPIAGVTTVEGIKVETPVRLSQGCMIGIGRSNYLRFNHPAEAELMKSVLPNTRISMTPIQFVQSEKYEPKTSDSTNQSSGESDKYEKLKNSLSNAIFKGQIALDSELEMINASVRKKKPPIAPRRMFRDIDQASNSSSSDQETHQLQQAPKSTNNIAATVSKFEFYLKNSQRNNAKNDVWSPKVFTADSATGNIPAKDVLVDKGRSGERVVIVNEPRHCSYSNVAIRSQTGKIDQITKVFESNKSMSPLDSLGNRMQVKYHTPSPSFNRNPVFNVKSPNDDGTNQFPQKSGSVHNNSAALQDKLNDESQRILEQARIDEIINLCAEYEKQNSLGIPTTPTEKKVHSKIITNGSLPRGFQHNPNIVQNSDGSYRFDTGKNKNGNIMNSPEFPNSFHSAEGSRVTSPTTPIQIQHGEHFRLENHPHSNRQFPITELSSPLMIRKIARNAQNSSNYAGNFECAAPNINSPSGSARNVFSPYENVTIANSAGSPTNPYIPKSPNTNSPRTRIKTTYANKNTQPQHFVFPSPPPNYNNPFNVKSPGIEKQLSLTEDIPMIDDMEFANELEMRISKLKPENRANAKEDDLILDPLQNLMTRRNFEDIKRDLIADIPELDAIQEDLDKNLLNSFKNRIDEFHAELHSIANQCMNDNACFNDNLETTNEKPSDEEKRVIITEDNQQAYTNVELNPKGENSTQQNIEFNMEVFQMQLETLYSRRKNIMNDMKEIKTEINDIELSRKQSQNEMEEFENRLEKLQEGLQVQKDIRKDEVEMVAVTDGEKVNFKQAQEERQMEMKEMQAKLEQAEERVKKVERSFSKGVATLEELRHAQESLENDKKIFEDMEFQHLEKESEFYSRIAKEQNVLKNDPWGTCKKMNKLEYMIHELHNEIDLSEGQFSTKNSNDNPRLRVLLDKLETLEEELCNVNEEINKIKKNCGVNKRNETFGNLESYKARIKSGDFSPPTSDDDDMNEIRNRINPIVQNTSTPKVNEIQSCVQEQEEKSQSIKKIVSPAFDPMSMSMIVEKQSDFNDVCNQKEDQKNSQMTKPLECVETAVPEKKGFFERNFDSLSRLKNKDKKSKNQDIMSQSLNENMFFNNDNIESEFGSFDKGNSLKNNNSKNKEKAKSEEPSKSKLSAFSSLGRIIRRDSLGKKNKDKGVDDKENVNVNEESPPKDTNVKNSKPRYLKNSRNTTTENKYANKSKVAQNSNSSNDNLVPPPDEFKLTFTYFDENNLTETQKVILEKNKITFRKSAGDEIKKPYLLGENLGDNTKIPSQDDIDRISKVTLDAPLFAKNGDVHSLGRKTLDSLRELEKQRVALLEQKGCQVIENEREKMTELKRRVQNETLMKWEENQMKSRNKVENETCEDSIKTPDLSLQSVEGANSSCLAGESVLLEKQHRNSRSDSYIEDERSTERQSSPLNGVRPLSELSDMSSENGASPQPLMEGPRRSRKTSANSLSGSFNASKNREDLQRPLTRYLPIDNDDLNLRQHIESAGHQVDLCPHISIDDISCRGYLHKLGAKFHGWSKRWFVFDRSLRTLVYYSDKSERKPRGGAYFQVIEEVYLDHLNASRSPSPLTTFVVKTRQRKYYLMAPSGPAARIWIDVVFTGAQGYTEYMQ